MISKLTVMRCKKCNQRLCDHQLIEGTIQILCMYNAGRGQGACRTLNIVTVKRTRAEKITQITG